jgi:hypothetical protein
MHSSFSLINPFDCDDFDNLWKKNLPKEFKYSAFVLENKKKDIALGYFSDYVWGQEYTSLVHSSDPVRSLCKTSNMRMIIWNRLALTRSDKEFMSCRYEKCGINQGITFNLVNNEEQRIISLATNNDYFCVEKYCSENIDKLVSLIENYTLHIYGIKASS